MAVGQLSLTRRALLAGACAVPAVGEGFSAPLLQGRWMPDRVRHDERGQARWRAAVELYRGAEAALAALAQCEDEALYDQAGRRCDAAVKRLLRTPAPDLAAFAWKIDLLFDQALWELGGAERCLGAVRRDAHRFAGG